MHTRTQHVSDKEHIVRFDTATENYVITDRFQVDTFTDANGVTIEIVTSAIFNPAKASITHLPFETVDKQFIANDLHGDRSSFLEGRYGERYQPTSLIQPILDGVFVCRVGWLIYRKDIPIETILSTLQGIENEIPTSKAD